MQLQFNGLPDEAVHIARLGRQKFGILKSDFVVQIDAMFSHSWFIGLVQFYMPPVFLNALLNGPSALSNIHRPTFTRDAVDTTPQFNGMQGPLYEPWYCVWEFSHR